MIEAGFIYSAKTDTPLPDNASIFMQSVPNAI